MQSEVIFSGFGGQGALFAGQLLAYSAMEENKHVTWLPSYGPEMRGGTAHCIVIVSDDPIGSPVIRRPGAAIVMNTPSMDKYESLVKPGGVLVVNRSLVARDPVRHDITNVLVAGNDIAESCGDLRMANVVLLGALLKTLPLVSNRSVMLALEKHIPSRHRDLLEANASALELGAEAATSQAVAANAQP
jgi:2-oxoglutarate ferredoxin oxidoreductase subunit gamma